MSRTLTFRNTPDGASFGILTLHGTALRTDTAEDTALSACAERLGRLIGAVSPDLVLFCGDTLSEPKDPDAVRSALAVLTKPLSDADIPFAMVPGDREQREGCLSVGQQTAIWKTLPGFHALADADALGYNDVLPVCRKDGTPALLLWLFDTHGEIGGYEKTYGAPYRARLARPIYTKYYMDGVRFSQTTGYRRTAEKTEAEYGKKLPGLFFFHTPLPEYTMCARNALQTGMNGTQTGEVRCQTVDGGLFLAAAERHDVSAMIAAHNGENCFAARYCGITLLTSPGFGSPLGDGLLLTWKLSEEKQPLSCGIVSADGGTVGTLHC